MTSTSIRIALLGTSEIITAEIEKSVGEYEELLKKHFDQIEKRVLEKIEKDILEIREFQKEIAIMYLRDWAEIFIREGLIPGVKTYEDIPILTRISMEHAANQIFD
jgi:hypothetical protein